MWVVFPVMSRQMCFYYSFLTGSSRSPGLLHRLHRGQLSSMLRLLMIVVWRTWEKWFWVCFPCVVLTDFPSWYSKSIMYLALNCWPKAYLCVAVNGIVAEHISYRTEAEKGVRPFQALHKALCILIPDIELWLAWLSHQSLSRRTWCWRFPSSHRGSLRRRYPDCWRCRKWQQRSRIWSALHVRSPCSWTPSGRKKTRKTY